MRSITHARRAGRALRRRLDPGFQLSAHELFLVLCAYLRTEWEVEVHPSLPRRLKERRASVEPGLLYYDRTLDNDPIRRLRVVAHEAGHVVQHRRVHGQTDLPDPAQVMTRTVGERGPAEARYTPVTRDEVQAESFGLEFACPASDALELWEADEQATSATVGRRFHTTPEVARAQLGEALHERLVGTPPPEQQEPEADGDTLAPAAFGPDDRQRLAITHAGSAALVDAGPGCGKTFTLVERVVWRIAEDVRKASEEGVTLTPAVAARRILVLTFSTEAAAELEERLERRLGRKLAAEVEVATFHGLGRQILAVYGGDESVSRHAPVLDDAAQRDLLSGGLGAPGAERILDLKNLEATAREAARHLQHVKLRLTRDPATGLRCPWTPDLFDARVATLEAEPVPAEGAGERAEKLAAARAFAAVFRAYEAAKAARGAVDFADLIAKTVVVLRSHPTAVRHYGRRHVLVDEFQDVSRTVGLFLELLCGDKGEPWVVGDPNQSIYRFLNADPETLARFPEAFRGADTFQLASNYRSAPEVVHLANALAALLQFDDEAALGAEPRFTAASPVQATPALDGLAAAVVLAVAESDAAERAGVVATVCGWLERGIAPHEIAVLARRNADVREIVLALGRQGVRASAGAMMTPEGTAGDLAVVVTWADGTRGFRASLPRVAHALAQGRYAPERVDTVIALLLDRVPPGYQADIEATLAETAREEVDGLVGELARAYRVLRAERYAGDGFTMIAAFLFDGSDYARRLLATVGQGGVADDRAEAALAEAASTLRLAEAASTLARSAAYRHAHPDTDGVDLHAVRRRARIDFADTFRRALTSGIPTSMAPPRVEGAVQVMTCHASKGLEFPCVCVVGQTLSPLGSSFDWLPDDLQPTDTQDIDQANALFFVGATRAQQSLVVSYALRPTADRGKPRQVTPLIERWERVFAPARVEWTEPEVDPLTPEAVQAPWGRHGTPQLTPHHLDVRTCQIATYLEEFARLRFPEVDVPLYPLYVNTVTFTIQQIVRAAHERGRGVEPNEAVVLFDRSWWAVAKLNEEHPHVELYERVGRRTVRAFATAYASPLATAHRPVELIEIERALHPELAFRSGLLTAFFSDEGHPVVFLFRTESYARPAAVRGHLVWSDLQPKRQIPLALFHQRWAATHPGVTARVFSAMDGVLYAFEWSRQAKSMSTLHAKTTGQFADLISGPYTPQANEWACDRCRSRVGCPHQIRG